MTKVQAVTLVIFVAIVLIVVEIVIHTHNQPQEQTTAANDCIALCQTVYDESGTGAPSSQEQNCENVCNKSAGLPASTNSQ